MAIQMTPSRSRLLAFCMNNGIEFSMEKYSTEAVARRLLKASPRLFWAFANELSFDDVVLEREFGI